MKKLCLISIVLLVFTGCTNENTASTTPLGDFKAPFYFGMFGVPANNPLTEEGVKLGRMLFYETQLSINNNVSCATCHQQSKAFTDGRAFAIGVTKKPILKSTMSLSNLLWGPQHFFWDGRAATLEEQSLIPIVSADEMGLTLPEAVNRLEKIPEYPSLFEIAFGSEGITPERIGKALASFQRTLISYNSKYDKYLRGEAQLTEQELLGRQLFTTHPDPEMELRGGNCGDCHSQFLTSGFNTGFDGFTNNGIDVDSMLGEGLKIVTGNLSDRGKFKVPSLRNIALTAPYMHDGRFKTLEEVLEHYNSGVKESSTLDPLMRETSNLESYADNALGVFMTEEEKAAILAFLYTLTDEDFIKNEKFSNPNN